MARRTPIVERKPATNVVRALDTLAKTGAKRTDTSAQARAATAEDRDEARRVAELERNRVVFEADEDHFFGAAYDEDELQLEAPDPDDPGRTSEQLLIAEQEETVRRTLAPVGRELRDHLLRRIDRGYFEGLGAIGTAERYATGGHPERLPAVLADSLEAADAELRIECRAAYQEYLRAAHLSGGINARIRLLPPGDYDVPKSGGKLQAKVEQSLRFFRDRCLVTPRVDVKGHAPIVATSQRARTGRS